MVTWSSDTVAVSTDDFPIKYKYVANGHRQSPTTRPLTWDAVARAIYKPPADGCVLCTSLPWQSRSGIVRWSRQQKGETHVAHGDSAHMCVQDCRGSIRADGTGQRLGVGHSGWHGRLSGRELTMLASALLVALLMLKCAGRQCASTHVHHNRYASTRNFWSVAWAIDAPAMMMGP
jgi:hypothetical protein